MLGVIFEMKPLSGGTADGNESAEGITLHLVLVPFRVNESGQDCDVLRQRVRRVGKHVGPAIGRFNSPCLSIEDQLSVLKTSFTAPARLVRVAGLSGCRRQVVVVNPGTVFHDQIDGDTHLSAEKDLK